MTNTQRSFGLWRSTALVIGNIIGSGIFMLPAALGRFGTLGLGGWIVTCCGSMCLAFTFARLGKHFPKTGGPYAYSREAFGDFVGFQMAWSYWIGTWASNAAIATAFVSYMSVFWPEVAHNGTAAFFMAIGAAWFFTAVNLSGMRTAGVFQVVIVVLKIIPLILIGIVGMFFVKTQNYLPINPSGGSWYAVISSSAALTLFALLGIESATIPADNVVNPEKTIPRATIIGTAVSAIIYVWTTTVLLGVVPAAQLATSNAPFSDGARVILGEWGAGLVAICAALSAFGTLNGWIMMQGQVPLAAARDGVFPAAFAKLSKNGSPFFGLIVSSLLMTAMLAMNYKANLVDQFTTIVTFTTFTVLLPYLYSSVADLVFLVSRPGYAPAGAYVRALGISLLGFAYTVLIVAGSGQEAVYFGMICVFAGFPIYFVVKSKTMKTDLLPGEIKDLDAV